MIYAVFTRNFASDKKEEREKIYKELTSLLKKAGPRLTPVPKETLSILDKDPHRIYRISDMHKEKFGQRITDLDPEALFFGARMFGQGGIKRIRKFALITYASKKYIIMQQSVDFSNIMSVLDIADKKRYRVRNLNQIETLLKAVHAPIDQVPLLVNDPALKYNSQLKKMILDRLGY